MHESLEVYKYESELGHFACRSKAEMGAMDQLLGRDPSKTSLELF